MKRLYIIAGCNGAGKTTASFTVLPEMLNCKEFVNADEIARGLSPFQPEKVAFEAGRIMLNRMEELLRSEESFAFETTLASKTFVKFIKEAKFHNFEITLIFFWLKSHEIAVERVKTRVLEGGHNIPTDIIERRYKSGLFNFFNIYINKVDNWMFVDNSETATRIIGERFIEKINVYDIKLWEQLKKENEQKGKE